MNSEKSNEWTLVNKKQKNVSFAPTTFSTYSNIKNTSTYEKITIKRNGQTKTY